MVKQDEWRQRSRWCAIQKNHYLDEYQTTTTTLNASSGTNGVADATGSFGVTDAMPTSERSGTLIVNNEEIEIQERKRALRLQSTQDGDLGFFQVLVMLV